MLTKEKVIEMINDLKRDAWFFEEDNRLSVIINNAFGYYDDGTVCRRCLDHPEKISAFLRTLGDECVTREVTGPEKNWESFQFDTFSVDVTYRVDEDLF